MTLKVLGRADSSNVQAVMWGAAELGVSPERADYGHRFGGLDTPEFRAMNPHGVVPVLVDGDRVVWESAAILRYLAARYGDGGAFWPGEPGPRAGVDMWAEWAKGTVQRDFARPVFWARVRTSAADRNPDAFAAALARFEGHLKLVESELAGRDWLAGAAFSLADVMFGHLLFRWYDMDIPRADRPHVEAYYARLAARPAYRQHVMVDYGALRHPEAG